MANDKTEKATPKRRDEARKQGQVARSQDLTGASIMLVGVFVLGITGSAVAGRMADVMRQMLRQIADPSVVDKGGIGSLLSSAGSAFLHAVLPVAFACVAAAVVVTVAQIGFKPTPKALKFDPKRINPLSGAKNLFSPNSAVEGLKSVLKMAIVGGVVALALLPKVTQLGAMVGVSPITLSSELVHTMRALALRAGMAYLLIGAVDVFWQRHRHEKSMRMDKQEIKEEAKQQQLPPEVRSAIRRRQMQAARARMMQAVPTADVVVTNPTHFSVALKYDASAPAPQVVAKGQDLVALRIRELATEHGVPIVPDPPLARSLHASVEIGQQIPAELFHAVAQVLAFVYRQAARRRALVGAPA